MSDEDRVARFAEALAQLRRLQPILKEIQGEAVRAAEHHRRDAIFARAGRVAHAIGEVRTQLQQLGWV